MTPLGLTFPNAGARICTLAPRRVEAMNREPRLITGVSIVGVVLLVVMVAFFALVIWVARQLV